MSREGSGQTPPAAAPLDTGGLTAAEAARLLAQHGPNQLQQPDPPSALALLLRQFQSPLVALLLAAAALSGALGELADAVAISAILALNAAVGFAQENRAERALLALRAMTAPRARVQRDGRAQVIAAAEVVPGDRLLLEAGDLVAADARILEAHGLSTVEAALTGESLPVSKRAAPSAPDAPLAERHDQVFASTAVAAGAGVALVLHTGMRTEVGRIATLLAEAEDGATPLQRRLERVSRSLIWICLAVVAAVGLAGLARGQPWMEVLLASVSLAVAAVPEGLPAVVTIALAVGVQRMAARHVLVRRLHAVETLGSATVICTDKTGTLTTGEMAVRAAWGPDEAALLRAAAACCDAELAPDGRGGVGDPTELAILAAAAARGLHRAEIESSEPRISEKPFDSDRKRMSVLRQGALGPALYVKGAAEAVLPRCVAGADRQAAAAQGEAMAADGLRVLAVATGQSGEEQDLCLLGLVGLADPPRPEAVEAVAAARGAGVITVMITGDHPVTARAIARELGVLGRDDAPGERVHARVTPEDKLRIVRGWKEAGHVVAMTGDGVNDAPAIREAHIGIAMGRGGTEVTREAADVVLTDDNFASVVAGVREGRTITENIRKTLIYLLAGNAAELAVMLGAAVGGLPIPFLPLQILWINLLTDGLPALALVMDPPDGDTLTRPPRPPDEPLLGRRQWTFIALSAAVEAAVVLGLFAVTWRQHGLSEARSLAFTTLVLSELFRAFAARSDRRVLWEVGAFSNLRLLGVVALTLALQLLLFRFSFSRELFGLVEFDIHLFIKAALFALIPVTALELSKLARRLGSAVGERQGDPEH